MPSSRKKQVRRLKRAASEITNTDATLSVSNEENGATTGGYEQDIVKFINRIFSENLSHSHRLAAVEVMCDQLEKMSTDDIYSQAIGWLGHLSKTMESCKAASGTGLALCCHTISQLLIICSRSADLRRIISLNVVPKLLSSTLEIEVDSEDISLIGSINLMKICVKYFGGASLAFKNKVEAYVLRVALAQEDSHSAVVQTCCTTISYLPFCGGQGSTGNKHSEMWSNQMARLLCAIEGCTTYMYSPCALPAKDEAADPVLGQPFPKVAVDLSAEGLSTCAHYISVYLTTLQCMLTTQMTWKVQVPVKHLLAVVCKLVLVTPDSVLFRRLGEELEVVKSALPDIHNSSMCLISTLAKLCGTSLYPYTTTLCELVSAQLQWTRVMMRHTAKAQYLRCRTQVYEVINSLQTEPGLYTVLTDVTDVLVEHSLSDVHPTTPTTQSDTNDAAAPKRPHKVSQRVFSNSSAAERKMKSSALAVVTQLLNFSATTLSSRHIKMVYDSLVDLTQSTQSCLPSSTDCYSVDSELRLALYRCLLASIFSYNSEVGPLTHIAVRLISTGLVDKCPQVRSLCNHNLLVCELAVQPRAPPLTQHTDTSTKTGASKSTDSVTTLFDEVTNQTKDIDSMIREEVTVAKGADSEITVSKTADPEATSARNADSAFDTEVVSDHSASEDDAEMSSITEPAHSPPIGGSGGNPVSGAENGEVEMTPDTSAAIQQDRESTKEVIEVTESEPAVGTEQAAPSPTTTTQANKDMVPRLEAEAAAGSDEAVGVGEEILGMLSSFVADGPDETDV